MGIIAGLLDINDDVAFGNRVGQRVVFDAMSEVVRAIENEATQFRDFFVQETTGEHTRRYKLPGGGYLQERSEQTDTAAVKPYGEWDVAFPLHDRGAQIAMTDVDFAYLTPRMLDAYLETVRTQYFNTLRRDIFGALMDNVARTIVDKRVGSITVQPLANGDSVTYPPVVGSGDAATDNHYIETNYAPGSISDTNNPFATIRTELGEHFGSKYGESDIVTLINSDALAKAELLTSWYDTPDSGVRYGNDVSLALSGPNSPGTRVGRANGVWVSVYDWIPATYMLAIDTAQPKPLIMRVDPEYTGLSSGLQLVSEEDKYPFKQYHYRARYGLGVGNRLNGVVLELGTGGTYTVPTAYDI